MYVRLMYQLIYRILICFNIDFSIKFNTKINIETNIIFDTFSSLFQFFPVRLPESNRAVKWVFSWFGLGWDVDS